VASHNIHAEPEFFNVHEYPDYLDVVDDIVDAHNPDVVNQIYEVQDLEASPTTQDYELLKPSFAWSPADTIKHTLSVTTQYARGRFSYNLQKHWKSCFPSCNVKCHNQADATVNVFIYTPAVFTGDFKAAHLFNGRKSLIADVYGIITDKEFVCTLEDNIRERGEIDKII
jgi:hypothetical protein